MSVFSRVIRHTIFPPAHLSVSVLSRNSASWLESCICLFVCVCVFVCVFPPYSRQVTIKEQSSPAGHQSEEELIRFSRSWGQRSKSCSNDHGNFN